MDLDPDFDDVASGKIARSKGPMIAAWIVVFHANLPVPLLFGVMFTHKAGRWGIIVAILILLTLGAFVVSWSRRGGLAVVVGGWIVATSQFWPLLQFYAGIVGLSVAHGEGKKGPSDREDEMGGFIATILTGGILITVALAIGAALLLMRAVFTLCRGDRYAKPLMHKVLN